MTFPYSENFNEGTISIQFKMEENSPQHSRSDTGASPNVECFQNYNASEVFVQGLAGMVNQQDTETIIRSQKYM